MNKKEDASGPRITPFQTKRIYERPSVSDGTRILVDRLWPRGVTKTQAAVHVWMKEIAPSPALRAWFGHAPARWLEFRKHYAAELEANEAGVRQLAGFAATGPVTLLYAARDEAHNHASVLAGYMTTFSRRRGRR
jgi:uncharacterized protein YeaO (DUF488 family)